MFDLTRPCAKCPFRNDVDPYLTRDRVVEILNDLFDNDRSFHCHETVVYDDDGEPDTTDSQHCAGAMILMERTEHANQMMRIGERIGVYDRRKLDMDAPVYGSRDEMQRRAVDDYSRG